MRKKSREMQSQQYSNKLGTFAIFIPLLCILLTYANKSTLLCLMYNFLLKKLRLFKLSNRISGRRRKIIIF